MKNTKKRGFTLIELLAVIVILAIIALIATPIILNMITKARKNAARTSALGYVDAIEYNNGFADVEQEGYTKVTGTKQVSELSEIKLKGKRPTSGTVTINEKGTVTRAELCINGYNVTYENNDATVGNKCNDSESSTPKVQPVSFDKDDWSVIAANTTSDKYKVGDTKCIKLNGFTTTNNNGCSNGEFKVRIANKTACTTETSKTACGFVVEFVDIISEHNMNPSGEYKGTQYDYGWNVDGYPASAMYQEYFASNATNSLYAKLPSDLQSAIIDTKVISGHGSTTGETNFESNDKLYLLSTKEVGFNVSTDSVKDETRILDYYNTNNNNASRIKQYNGSNKAWWLRSAHSRNTIVFCIVNTSGSYSNFNANGAIGVAPAFRIG